MLEQPPCCHTPCSHQTAKQRRRSPLLTTPAATTAHLDDVGKGHAIARQHQHLGGPRLKVAARLHQPAGWWGASGPHRSRCRVVHVCRHLSTAVYRPPQTAAAHASQPNSHPAPSLSAVVYSQDVASLMSCPLQTPFTLPAKRTTIEAPKLVKKPHSFSRLYSASSQGRM